MVFTRTLRVKPGYDIYVVLDPKPWNCWIEIRDGDEIIDMIPATTYLLLRNSGLQLQSGIF